MVVLLWPSVHILVITVAMNVGGYMKLLMELCKTPFEAFATRPKGLQLHLGLRDQVALSQAETLLEIQ